MDPTLTDLLCGSRDVPAIEDARGSMTRGDLAAAAAAVMAALGRQGVGPGDRVAVVAARGAPLVAALPGARALGALVAPIDPGVAPAVLARLRPRAVIADRPLGVPAIPLEAALRGGGGRLEPATGPATAWAVSTSGTLGRPRLVLLTERSVAHVTGAVHEVIGYRPDDRVLCAVPLHHTYGLSQLWLALRSGALLLLPPAPLPAGDLARWAERATVLAAIRPAVKALLRTSSRPALRLVTLAGQATPPDDRRRFAAALPATGFVNFYGLTEATTRVLWLAPEKFLSKPEAAGQAIPGVRVRIARDGELWVEGPNVAAGYLDDPEATAERFPGGALRTGDLFERDGDLYRFLGRRDGAFKRWGEKVVPETVERALASHPAVEECMVVAQASEDGESAPVAYVVAAGAPPAEAELLRHVRARVPAAMVPARVTYVAALPTAPSGKLLRRPPE